MVSTRPHLARSVSMVSRFMSNPRKAHLEVVQGIMWSLKGSNGLCVMFGSFNDFKGLIGYVDSNVVIL